MELKNLQKHIRTLAEQTQCQVETVNDSPILMEFGGVGCLLRYLLPEQAVGRLQEVKANAAV